MPVSLKTMVSQLLTIVAVSSILSSCLGLGASSTRYGMVSDENTGLMFGSSIGSNIVTDASFFTNQKIKVRMRNTSGDPSFDLFKFKSSLENAYRNVGYTPTSKGDFGLIVDVNVRYSGQVQENMSTEYLFLGAAAGGLAGYSNADGFGAAVGTVSGAALGNIVGSFVTDDTYIIVVDVTIGVVRESKDKSSKTITFRRSTNYDEDEEVGERKFRSTHNTQVAVFAGGRNVDQSDISEQVRERIIRIVSNII